MTERQLLVIEPKPMQNRGVEIVNVHRVLDDLGAIVIGLAENETALAARAGPKIRAIIPGQRIAR